MDDQHFPQRIDQVQEFIGRPSAKNGGTQIWVMKIRPIHGLMMSLVMTAVKISDSKKLGKSLVGLSTFGVVVKDALAGAIDPRRARIRADSLTGYCRLS